MANAPCVRGSCRQFWAGVAFHSEAALGTHIARVLSFALPRVHRLFLIWYLESSNFGADELVVYGSPPFDVELYHLLYASIVFLYCYS